MDILTDCPWRVWAACRAEAVALRTPTLTLSWRALAARIETLAQALCAQGIAPGVGVALRGKNSLALLLCYLAALRCGARVLPLNPQLPLSLCRTLLPTLDITAVWGAPDETAALAPGATVLHDQAPDRTLPLPDWSLNRPATLTLTSGSTGLPKAAVHTVAAHLASALGVNALLDFQAQDNWLLSLPLYHVSGQGIVWRWLQAGAQLTLAEHTPLAQAIAGCTFASLVPTQLQRLLREPARVQPLALRAVLLGGAMIPTALTAQAEAAGIRCWCGYGMTEMASTITAGRAMPDGDVGVPLAGREIRLEGEEVLVRGLPLALGYWRHGAIEPLTDPQGWFHTRDRGWLAAGRLFIAGRLDNLFFSGGEGVQPETVEKVLLRCPGVRQAVVVPLEDEEFGARPVAVIDQDEPWETAPLIRWVSDKLPRYQQPVGYLPLPAHLQQGGIKLSRHAIQQWVASQRQRLMAQRATPPAQ